MRVFSTSSRARARTASRRLAGGASEAVFVESAPAALAVLRENLERTRLAERAVCIAARLPEGLQRLGGAFDVILADPPYHYAETAALL